MRNHTGYWYHASLDRLGRASVEAMVRYSHPQKIWEQYRHRGFDVYRSSDVSMVPHTIVEAEASRLRDHWRHWLYIQAFTGIAMGPLGLGLTVSGLSMVCLNWGIQLGWAYGIRMDSSDEQDTLRLLVANGLRDTMGLNLDRSGWRKMTSMGINVVLLGFGQDLAWADKVMGVVRHRWRLKSGRLPAAHRELLTFRRSPATVRQDFVVTSLEFAHNDRNSDRETRRCAP